MHRMTELSAADSIPPAKHTLLDTVSTQGKWGCLALAMAGGTWSRPICILAA